MTTLVIAAHPDDEVLGCGGTIAKLAQEEEVAIAILGEGITSRPGQTDAVSGVRQLEDCGREVAGLLGAGAITFHGLPDNRFDSLPLLDIVHIIEGLVRECKPRVIYTHHGGDLNVDHQLTSRAVLTATRPMAGSVVEELYAFEVPSSTEWAFHHLGPGFRPNTFVDIAATLETKVLAMEMYTSEVRPFPHPRSSEALRAYARRWGSAVGWEAAEAFTLIRAIR